MAENNEERSTEDLTEEASPYRIEEYRRKGIVSQSRELTGIVGLFFAAAATYALAPTLGTRFLDYMHEMFRVEQHARVELSEATAWTQYIFRAVKLMAFATLPIAFAALISGVLGSFAQVGSIFSIEPLMPDFSKINPLNGFKKIFSPKQLVELLRISLKVSFVCFVAYGLIKVEMGKSQAYILADISQQLIAFADSGKRVFLMLLLVVAVFAGADYAWQRYQFGLNLRLTKQEAKQEAKEREGDPQMKARIRSVQRESARKRMMTAVKKADVIVTNPTHFAVALIYDRDKMAAPKVVAKGQDLIAQQIKKVAAEAGIPMVENVPLARALYKAVKIGGYVPRNLYQAVAEVLAYVYRLRAQRKGLV